MDAQCEWFQFYEAKGVLERAGGDGGTAVRRYLVASRSVLENSEFYDAYILPP